MLLVSSDPIVASLRKPVKKNNIPLDSDVLYLLKCTTPNEQLSLSNLNLDKPNDDTSKPEFHQINLDHHIMIQGFLISNKRKANSSEDTDVEASANKNQKDQKDRASKKRQYNSSYLSLGFTSVIRGDLEKPMCFLCSKILASDSTRPAKLKWHQFVNLTTYKFPTDVKLLLGLGPKFSINPVPRWLPIKRLLSDVEYIIKLAPSSSHDVLRAKCTNNITNYAHQYSTNPLVYHLFETAAHFLKTHENIIITSADKGNVSICPTTVQTKDGTAAPGSLCLYNTDKRPNNAGSKQK
ncbi:hypothetical protein WA026_021744 [Henosepilachna vigintioctopunctata]|uniref:Uncharacterized protein n=1 Tax=Henosepilachna vigintioctopunctata TaxID=420089 RepID=A0AAW1TXD8_9CUCU